MDYSLLKPGHSLTPRRVNLSQKAVTDYIQAVGDDSPLYTHHSLVPPSALVALGLKGIIGELSIPGGTIHAGQEVEFYRAVETDQELSCLAIIAQNAVRGQWRFLTIDFSLQDVEGRLVMKGKSTILLPV